MTAPTTFCYGCNMLVDDPDPVVCLDCLFDAEDRIKELELALKTIMHQVSHNPAWKSADPDYLCTCSDEVLSDDARLAKQAWKMAVKAMRRVTT